MGIPFRVAQITEAGVTFWKGGKLVPGVGGVLAVDNDITGGTAVLTVGSGSYSFAMLA